MEYLGLKSTRDPHLPDPGVEYRKPIRVAVFKPFKFPIFSVEVFSRAFKVRKVERNDLHKLLKTAWFRK